MTAAVAAGRLPDEGAPSILHLPLHGGRPHRHLQHLPRLPPVAAAPPRRPTPPARPRSDPAAPGRVSRVRAAVNNRIVPPSRPRPVRAPARGRALARRHPRRTRGGRRLLPSLPRPSLRAGSRGEDQEVGADADRPRAVGRGLRAVPLRPALRDRPAGARRGGAADRVQPAAVPRRRSGGTPAARHLPAAQLLLHPRRREVVGGGARRDGRRRRMLPQRVPRVTLRQRRLGGVHGARAGAGLHGRPLEVQEVSPPLPQTPEFPGVPYPPRS